MNDELIRVMIQAFYGNRTITETSGDEIGWLLLGWTGEKGIKFGKSIDADKFAIKKVNIPDTEYMIVYNPVAENDTDERAEKPLGFIPEIGLEIYSRCLICRRDKDGNYESLKPEDYDVVKKYLAE